MLAGQLKTSGANESKLNSSRFLKICFIIIIIIIICMD
jgi:hypothetical protein